MAMKITTTDGTVFEGSPEEIIRLRGLEGIHGDGEPEGNADEGLNIELNRDFEFYFGDEEDDEEINVGDTVILDAGFAAGYAPLAGFENGDECEVIDVGRASYAIEAETSIGHATGDQLIKVADEENEKDAVNTERPSVGDTVKLARGKPEIFPLIGTELKVMEDDGSGIPFRLEDSKGNEWWMTEGDIEIVETDVEEYAEFGEGDIVMVTKDHAMGSRNKRGDIGIVEDSFYGGGVYVQVLARKERSVDGIFHSPKSLQLICRAKDRHDLQ